MRAILTYHSIDPSGSVISTDRDAFRRQMRWLAASAVRAVPLDDILHPTDDDAVAVTFDDGFRNFATEAVPVLRDLGIPATVFLVTGCMGGGNTWEAHNDDVPDLPLLSWDDAGALAEEGVGIGAHTRSHPRLTELTGSHLHDELAGSAEDIRRRLGVRPSSVAYPYGSVNAEAEAEASRTFDVGVTAELDVLGRDLTPMRLPRLDMYYYRSSRRLESWGTAEFRRHLALRKTLRRVRRVVSGVVTA